MVVFYMWQLYKDNNMNQLDEELHARKVKFIIIDVIILSGIAYALYTYVWPTFAPYIH
jgi:hypothetical protein